MTRSGVGALRGGAALLVNQLSGPVSPLEFLLQQSEALVDGI